jgi:hypothetical protein
MPGFDVSLEVSASHKNLTTEITSEKRSNSQNRTVVQRRHLYSAVDHICISLLMLL